MEAGICEGLGDFFSCVGAAHARLDVHDVHAPLPTFDDDEEGPEQANASHHESDKAEHWEAGVQFC
jgi:hypothetical protein